jgi:sulfur relay protein TusB/DsrH
MLADLAAQGRVFALQGDVEARGISSKVADNIKLVDYAGLWCYFQQYFSYIVAVSFIGK